jgi:hypothetical protein
MNKIMAPKRRLSNAVGRTKPPRLASPTLSQVWLSSHRSPSSTATAYASGGEGAATRHPGRRLLALMGNAKHAILDAARKSLREARVAIVPWAQSSATIKPITTPCPDFGGV